MPEQPENRYIYTCANLFGLFGFNQNTTITMQNVKKFTGRVTAVAQKLSADTNSADYSIEITAAGTFGNKAESSAAYKITLPTEADHVRPYVTNVTPVVGSSVNPGDTFTVTYSKKLTGFPVSNVGTAVLSDDGMSVTVNINHAADCEKLDAVIAGVFDSAGNATETAVLSFFIEPIDGAFLSEAGGSKETIPVASVYDSPVTFLVKEGELAEPTVSMQELLNGQILQTEIKKHWRMKSVIPSGQKKQNGRKNRSGDSGQYK